MIDADGIHNWFQSDDDPAQLSDWGKAVFHGAVSNRLNTRRAIREQIEPKLDELLHRVANLNDRLTRLEERLDGTNETK